MNIATLHQLLCDNPRAVDGYHQQVRDAVARYARRRREQGAFWSEVETEVGVSDTSMRKWISALGPAAFQQVLGACRRRAAITASPRTRDR